MKNRLITLLGAMLWVSGVHAQHVFHSPEVKPVEEPPASINMRQNDFELCTNPFYVDIYKLTVEVFAQGAEQVQLADYEAQLFALVRASDEFADGGAEAFIEHIGNIPKQLIQIISEDPTVLDSCANFSVALVGPP